MMNKKLTGMLMAVGTACSVILSANANTIQVGDNVDLNFAGLVGTDGSVSWSGTANGSASAGAFYFTGVFEGGPKDGQEITPFYTFCTDINLNVNYTQDHKLVLNPPNGGSSPPPAWQTGGFEKAAWLYSQNVGTDYSQNQKGAAMQLAVWQLLYGGLTFSGVDSATATEYTTFMAQLANYPNNFDAGTWLQPLTAGSTQGFLYYPVPEPSTVIAALLLMAPMGLGVARGLRRKNAVK